MDGATAAGGRSCCLSSESTAVVEALETERPGNSVRHWQVVPEMFARFDRVFGRHRGNGV
jgi:hypothetical protein